MLWWGLLEIFFLFFYRAIPSFFFSPLIPRKPRCWKQRVDSSIDKYNIKNKILNINFNIIKKYINIIYYFEFII